MEPTYSDVSISITDLLALTEGESTVPSPSRQRLRTAESEAPPATGVRLLMIAVLEEAMRTFLTERGRVQAEAEAWIFAHRQRRWPFAFDVICETLDLHPGAVRRALAKLQRTGEIARRGMVRVRRNMRQSNIVQLRRRGKHAARRRDALNVQPAPDSRTAANG